MFRTLALVLMSFGLICGQAMASVQFTVSKRSYSVSGNTVQEVVRSMKRNGPHSENHGRRALGLADFRHRVSLKLKSDGNLCRVEQAKVRVRAWYIVPKLRKSASLRGAHLKRWRRISGMIDRHELQHIALYRRFANELHSGLRKLAAGPDCRYVRNKAKTLEKRLIKRNASRNRHYDRRQYGPFNRRLKLLAPR